MKTQLLLILFFSVNFLIQAQTEKKYNKTNKTHQFYSSQLKKNNGALYQSRELIPILDSVYNWSWDTISTTWKVSDRYIDFIYDANHNMTNVLEQSWIGTAWVDSEKTAFTVDASNNPITETYQEWTGTAWVYFKKITYTYDANNNNTNYLEQTWSGTAWVNNLGYQDTYTFDSNNNKTSYIKQTWNGTTLANSYKHTYTYDANNNNTIDLKQTWNGTAWDNTNGEQNIYTYDNNHNQTSQLYSGWDGTAWVDYYQTTSTYDANNNRISHSAETWNGSSWQIYSQTINTHDNNNNQTSDLTQNWNGTTWVNAFYFSQIFDTDNIPKGYTFKIWNSTGTIINQADSSYLYFHQTFVGINNLMANDENILIAPNPFHTQTTIFFTEEQNNCNIKIIDVLGKEIKTINFTGKQLLIEKEEMRAGIYFVQLIDDNKKLLNRKIVVQ